MTVVRELKLVYGRKRSIPQTISSPEEVFTFFKNLQEEPRENFIALYLNNKLGAVGWRTISIGTASETLIHPREVFQGALLCGASAVILIHNHPTGSTNPSKEDIETTQRLKNAGDILGVPVMDHVIIGGGFLSLKEGGYI